MDTTAARARDKAPLLYRIAKSMERNCIRGGTRLLRVLRHTGYLDRPVDFHLSDSVSIRVPIHRNEYDETDVQNYDSDFITSLATEINKLPPPVTLIDVGADIGLLSLRVLTSCPSISRIVAFEPNGEGFSWLQLNLSRVEGVQNQAVHAAIADFQGRGRLAIPDARFSPGVETNHTQFYIEPSPDGPIEVTTIDSLKLSAKESAVIKIDVEGGELAVLRGAVRTISEIPDCLVVFEAHPAVLRRTGIDPVECLRFLASLRPFRFFASEGGCTLHTAKPVFEQIAPDRVYNLIALPEYSPITRNYYTQIEAISQR